MSSTVYYTLDPDVAAGLNEVGSVSLEVLMNPRLSRYLTPSQAAVHLGVSAEALRLYEDHGLIAPARSAGGWRLYDPADIERAAWVVSLRALGLSLAEIRRVMRGDQRALEAGLAAHEERLLGQVRNIQATLDKVRGLRDDIARGAAVDGRAVDAASGRASCVGFELPWPWAGEWFALEDVPRLAFITGPLGSGKTRFAQRLAAELPDAVFLGLERLAGSGAGAGRGADTLLQTRISRTLEWLAAEGAERSDELAVLVGALEAETPRILVVDMVEEGLCKSTQRALMTYLRLRSDRKRAIFLMTRSSSILDLDLVSAEEAVIYCPANHSPPFRASTQPGGRGHEAVETCLGTPEARARTAGMVAMQGSNKHGREPEVVPA